MSAMNLHPFLRESLPRYRARILQRRAERLVSLERAVERVEEHHYDDQARLRLHRVIDRQVERGTLREQYAEILTSVADGATDAASATGRLTQWLERDTASVAAVSERQDLNQTVRDYAALVPATEWPEVLFMASSPAQVDTLESELRARALDVRRTGLSRFGILHAKCPPELAIVDRLCASALVACVADGAAPVMTEPTSAVEPQMANVPDLLGLTAEMRDEDAGLATIAVLDTGLDLRHPSFARVARGDYRNFTSWPDDDEEGHGTHVCFIAAGGDLADGSPVRGIAPRCRLIAGKVMHGRGFSTLEQVLDGMAWAVFDEHADVLSLSIGEERTPANGQSIWSRAVDEAFSQGTVVCVAAGNVDVAMPGTILVPGDARSAVTVGAVDNAGRLAAFSAQGESDTQSPLFGKPTCVAPGVDVVAARSSTSGDGGGAFVTFSGTSMAAPAVAGCLALLKSRARARGWEPTPAELVQVYYGACRPVFHADGTACSHECDAGHGLVDMAAAMRAIDAQGAAQGRRRGEVSGPRWTPNTCYACRRSYLTTVGTFSAATTCRVCTAPLCAVCWAIGRRACAEHATEETRDASGSPASVHAVPMPATIRKPEGGPAMSSFEAPAPCTPGRDQEMAGRHFLSRFSANTELVTELLHPVNERALRRQSPRQTPNRIFSVDQGIVRYNFAGSVLGLSYSPLAVVAIVLGPAAFERQGDRCEPATNLLRSVLGRDGLDADDKTFYSIGLFSPFGWPPAWVRVSQVEHNAEFYFVSSESGPAGTQWQVAGPQSARKRLFNPESESESRARLQVALKSCSDLALPGGTVALDVFADAHGFAGDDVKATLAAARLGYQVIEHRGRAVIQRSFN